MSEAQPSAAGEPQQPANVRPARGLRGQLVRLTLATLLPLIAVTAVAAWLFAEQTERGFERGARERTLALISAVDAELSGSISVLAALAQSVHLDSGDLRAFHAQARRVAASRADWLTVNLAPPSGQQLVNVLRPFGSALPAITERASFERVLATGRPVVGGMVLGKVTEQVSFGVRVPVQREGRTVYVLSAVVKPAAVAELLAAQRLPADWIGAIFDGERRIVARTAGGAESLGRPAAPSLQAALDSAGEGWFLGRTREGLEMYTPYNRSAATGWSVAIGIPKQQVDGAALQAMRFVAGGALLALALALLFALLMGRRIARPIVELAAAARAQRGTAGLDTRGWTPAAEVAELRRAIDEAARAASDREAARQRLLAITNNATVALFVLDDRQHCSFMNPAAERMTGYGCAEVLGRPLHEVIHHSHADGRPYPLADCPIDRAMPANDRQQGEDLFIHKDGRFYPVAYTASPIRRDGVAVGTIVEVRDIGFEKAAEAIRLDLLERERRARDEAEQANRAKDDFLAMLGHELRNPLAAIGNAAHLLERSPSAEHGERARGVIRRQVTHLARLVDDLLDASRVATGKIIVARAPVDLAEVVRRTVAVVGAGGKAEHHRVSLELDALWVEGDETRLEQVVSNLLTNALRYTPAGGHVAIRLAADDGDAVLTVADSGIGIAPAMLERVFELFVQGERGIDRRQGGLGIGLTLVRRLVELHGGSCQAASPGPNQGSVFTVRLPRTQAPPAAVEAAAAVAAAGPRRVLIVEDNEDARDMLADALQLAGHEVLPRADGPNGVAAARTLRPEAAVVDIGLPGLSGYEVARQIRATEHGRGMLLIALTGYGQREDARKALDAGFDAHLTKPADTERLLRLIAAGRSRGAASP